MSTSSAPGALCALPCLASHAPTTDSQHGFSAEPFSSPERLKGEERAENAEDGREQKRGILLIQRQAHTCVALP